MKQLFCRNNYVKGRDWAEARFNAMCCGREHSLQACNSLSFDPTTYHPYDPKKFKHLNREGQILVEDLHTTDT